MPNTRVQRSTTPRASTATDDQGAQRAAKGKSNKIKKALETGGKVAVGVGAVAVTATAFAVLGPPYILTELFIEKTNDLYSRLFERHSHTHTPQSNVGYGSYGSSGS